MRILWKSKSIYTLFWNQCYFAVRAGWVLVGGLRAGKDGSLAFLFTGLDFYPVRQIILIHWGLSDFWVQAEHASAAASLSFPRKHNMLCMRDVFLNSKVGGFLWIRICNLSFPHGVNWSVYPSFSLSPVASQWPYLLCVCKNLWICPDHWF